MWPLEGEHLPSYGVVVVAVAREMAELEIGIAVEYKSGEEEDHI